MIMVDSEEKYSCWVCDDNNEFIGKETMIKHINEVHRIPYGYPPLPKKAVKSVLETCHIHHDAKKVKLNGDEFYLVIR